MGKKDIKYVCQHITCRMPCHTGTVTIDEETYKGLYDAHPEKDIFRAPSGKCRLGTMQDFKILAIKDSESDNKEFKKKDLKTLKSELASLRKNFRKEEKDLKEKISHLEGETKTSNSKKS